MNDLEVKTVIISLDLRAHILLMNCIPSEHRVTNYQYFSIKIHTDTFPSNLTFGVPGSNKFQIFDF